MEKGFVFQTLSYPAKANDKSGGDHNPWNSGSLFLLPAHGSLDECLKGENFNSLPDI